jgi:ketosteroid isomerase-like protein
MNDDTLAIRAHKQSIANAQAGNKAGWLDLFADDAVVNDPVGPSDHDPEGQGFAGKARIAEFWDMMIGVGDLTIVSHRRIPCGEHVAACDVTATNNVGGFKTAIEMIVVYEVNDKGKLTSLKAYWDTDRVREQLAAAGL